VFVEEFYEENSNTLPLPAFNPNNLQKPVHEAVTIRITKSYNKKGA